MSSIGTGAIGDGLIRHGPQRSDGHARQRVYLPDGPSPSKTQAPK